jgi:hypothetical protein
MDNADAAFCAFELLGIIDGHHRRVATTSDTGNRFV